MHEQAAPQLGLEPGALGRHDPSTRGDPHHLLDVHRVQRERHRGFTGPDPSSQLLGAANPAHEVDPLVGPDVVDSEDRTEDPIGSLDLSLLQDRVLGSILGIGDPRPDKRLDFVGGIRGPSDLQRRVDSGEMAIAFSLYPTSLEQLMAVSDAGQVMPPKSTWFEPKLRSGLFVHELE